MAIFNTVPKTGTFGEAVDVINENFTITSVAIGELEYATRSNKGLFESLEKLAAAIPDPDVGDWALVGGVNGILPATIYVCERKGNWTDSGKDYEGDAIALNEYAKTKDISVLLESLNMVDRKVDAVSNECLKAKDLATAEDTEVTIGGVTMRTLTEEQFIQIAGNYAPNTLYVIESGGI